MDSAGPDTQGHGHVSAIWERPSCNSYKETFVTFALPENACSPSSQGAQPMRGHQHSSVTTENETVPQARLTNCFLPWLPAAARHPGGKKGHLLPQNSGF